MKSENIIKDKSFEFALKIIELYKYLRHEKKEYVLSKQLLRSGTSILPRQIFSFLWIFGQMPFYVYILKSTIDNRFYVGYTIDLKKRLDSHNQGKVYSTKNRRPFDLIYYEFCLNKNDALHREKYLKTSWGKRYIKNRLKNYLSCEIKQIFPCDLTGQRANVEEAQAAQSKKDFIAKMSIAPALLNRF